MGAIGEERSHLINHAVIPLSQKPFEIRSQAAGAASWKYLISLLIVILVVVLMILLLSSSSSSRWPVLHSACAYLSIYLFIFVPLYPRTRQSKGLLQFRAAPKPPLFPGFLVFLQDFLQEGHNVWAGAAAHPVPPKYSSAEDERQLPALGGEEIGKYSYKCDS